MSKSDTRSDKSTSRARWLAVATSICGLIFGATVWGLSPFLTGREEPWDARWPYYPIAMLAGGFVFGLASPRHFWAPVVGMYLGQVAYGYFALEPVGAVILPLFMSVGIFGVPPALLAAAVAYGVARSVRAITR